MGDVGMSKGIDNWLSSPIGNDLLVQAAVENAKSLYSIQTQAAEQIATNAENQQKMGASVLELSKQLTQDIDKRLQELLAVQAKQKEVGLWSDISGYVLTGAMVLGACLIGQPEIAAITIALFVCQKTGATDKVEHLIGGDHAWARALVGVAITGLAFSAGGAASAARGVQFLGTLGTAVMAGSSALSSVGLPENVIEATGLQGKDGALGVQAGFMALSLIGGCSSGVMLAKSGAQAMSSSGLAQAALKLSIGGSVVGMAGQSGTGFASGHYNLEKAEVTQESARAKSLMQMCDEIRNMGTSQGQQYNQMMTAVMNEAAREGVKVCEGMASANRFASHLVASA